MNPFNDAMDYSWLKYIEVNKYAGASKHKHNPREVHNKIQKRRRQQQIKKASRRKNAARL